MNKSDITTCKIIRFDLAPGGTGIKSEVVYYEYFVHGKQYETYNYFGDYSIKEGDCYKVKYSKDDPIVSEILFEEGTVDCNK